MSRLETIRSQQIGAMIFFNNFGEGMLYMDRQDECAQMNLRNAFGNEIAPRSR